MENSAICYVDGFFNSVSKVYGYASTIIYKNNEYVIKGHDIDLQYIMLENIVGELIAIMKALKFVKEILRLDRIDIYYEEGIEKIANGKETESYLKNRMMEIEISFHKVKNYSGTIVNERVDKLAKQECGIIFNKLNSIVKIM